MDSTGFVVLFGSAAAGAANPRDLDLVIGGNYSEFDARGKADAWWTRQRVEGRDLPLSPPPAEIWRQNATYVDGPRVCLLRPHGALGYAYEILAGDVAVEWVDVDSLPAAIRLATDGQPGAAAEMIFRLRQQGIDGRLPLSLANYDLGRPIDLGGYAGDGPVALETALARTGEQHIDDLIPELAAAHHLLDLLTTIRTAPGAWSGKRWAGRQEPALMAGLRQHWLGGTPAGCRGYVGSSDVLFEYAPSLSMSLILEIVAIHRPAASGEVA